jgi:acyl-CoA synthetase (NDP forming)
LTRACIRSSFEPKSEAVAVVSGDPGKIGSIIFANLRENVLKGTLKARVYALNPTRTRIGDQRALDLNPVMP